MSIPAVTGPYTGVNCRLTLTRSSVRTSPDSEKAYARLDEIDKRFSDSFGHIQSIVTSSGVNDSGLFETNLRDERFLPFEYAGAISSWSLQLPGNPSDEAQVPPSFDYRTISDVILHIRYTAREGGEGLRGTATTHFHELLKIVNDNASPIRQRLFAIHDEFPMEWARLDTSSPGEHTLALALRPEHYPFWAQRSLAKAKLSKLSLFANYEGNDNVNNQKVRIGKSTAENSPGMGAGEKVGVLQPFGLPPETLENPGVRALSAFEKNGDPEKDSLTGLIVQREGLHALWMLVEWGV